MAALLVFDIETVPDVAAIRRTNDVPADMPDADVAAWYAQARRAATGSDFAPLYLQKVVAIGCAVRDGARFKIACLGEPGDDEAELIRRFHELIDRFTPQLVSWNGSGFDLPVLHHRALIHGVTAARYWEWGDDDRDFRYNNYLSRYHTRHIDLMDVLAAYQPRANAPLDAMARLCGFPGKLGMEGSEVAAAVAAGRLAEVRDYCETDVLNTYLLYQRFRLMRGESTAAEYSAELSFIRERIAALDAPHWKAYLAAWDGGGSEAERGA
ncbi:MAG: 3'-5' exonuclease [Betaproteobacteria bacterium]|jgi:predicted PolB exonuclease-like 3'-5' exonuclease|nr:3'-5' exonuclease [Betaproteobacteria bacterium]